MTKTNKQLVDELMTAVAQAAQGTLGDGYGAYIALTNKYGTGNCDDFSGYPVSVLPYVIVFSELFFGTDETAPYPSVLGDQEDEEYFNIVFKDGSMSAGEYATRQQAIDSIPLWRVWIESEVGTPMPPHTPRPE